jgi:hypothetical protein
MPTLACRGPTYVPRVAAEDELAGIDEAEHAENRPVGTYNLVKLQYGHYLSSGMTCGKPPHGGTGSATSSCRRTGSRRRRPGPTAA